MAHLLIAYATKEGSTAEIAQTLAKELQAAGHTADSVDIGQMASPPGYDAVVIGGPVYMGHIDSRVKKFVKRHSPDLARVPVAGFAVGLSTASKDPEGMAWTKKGAPCFPQPAPDGCGGDICREAGPGEAFVVAAVDRRLNHRSGTFATGQLSRPGHGICPKR